MAKSSSTTIKNNHVRDKNYDRLLEGVCVGCIWEGHLSHIFLSLSLFVNSGDS